MARWLPARSVRDSLPEEDDKGHGRTGLALLGWPCWATGERGEMGLVVSPKEFFFIFFVLYHFRK